MTFQELKQLVVQEATVLKREASIKELMRLDFNSLDPQLTQSCIYGQMTGHCDSTRAQKLMQAALPSPILGDLPGTNSVESLRGFSKGVKWNYRGKLGAYFVPEEWSAIEVYITLAKAKPQVLIDFLQGDINQKLNANML